MNGQLPPYLACLASLSSQVDIHGICRALSLYRHRLFFSYHVISLDEVLRYLRVLGMQKIGHSNTGTHAIRRI